MFHNTVSRQIFLLLGILLVILPLTMLFIYQQQHIQQQAAGPTISPLIFGTNLTLNDANDQFLTSQTTRNALQAIHVQLIRMPIRGVGGPSPWEIQAMQDIKAMGIIPMIILKYTQPDPAGAAKLVMQQAIQIFGNSRVYYEFGNERDLNGVSQTQYTQTWNQVIPQLQSLSTGSQFGGPVNFQTNASYISYFVHNANPKPNFISWHEYTCGNADNPQTICIGHIANWATHISQTKSAITATGDTVPPIFITEWNYDPNNPSPDPRATPQFQTQFTQTALQELAKDGVIGATHYVATGHTEYNLVDPNGQLTAEGQTFGQMYIQLTGNIGSPTITSAPTISETLTAPQTSTQFSVIFCPHGLGNCGDNVNPASGGNINPLHMQRNATLAIFNNAQQQIATGQGTVIYNQSAQNFQGMIPVPNLSSGQYLVSVKTNNFLSRQLPGIISVTSGQTTTLTAASLVTGDVNNDNQLDLLDYNILIGCFGAKQSSPSCTRPPTTESSGADFNDDGKVDGVDYNLFLRELSVQKGNGSPSAIPTPT